MGNKEKNIFLDVACFFQGEDVNLVMKFLNASIYKLDMDIFIYSRIDESRINRRVTMIRKNNSGYICRDNLYNPW